MQIRTVEIEFVEDTFDEFGEIRRNKGDHMLVDKVSAHSFCDVKKVARRLGDGPTVGTNKRVPKFKRNEPAAEDPPETTKRATKREPKPEPAPEAEPKGAADEPIEPVEDVAG